MGIKTKWRIQQSTNDPILFKADLSLATPHHPLRIRRSVGDLKKSYDDPYASDHLLLSNDNGDCETTKALLNCYSCYEQTVSVISLYLHDIKSLTCYP